MNIVRKDIDSVNAIIKMQIGKSDYQEAVDKTLRTYRQKANVPGFRPGNIPMGIVKKMFGKAAMADEINKLISEKLYGYIKENNIQILGEPLPNQTEQQMIDFDTQEEFEFVFDVAVAPEFKIELNKEVSSVYYDIEVDDKMIDNTVKSYTGRFGSYEEATEVEENDVIKGDVVELATKTKEKEDGIKAEDAVLSPKYVKAAAQKKLFVGAKIGDSIVFNPKKAFENDTEIASLLKIKKEDVENLASDFRFTVKGITRYKEAELNQELFDKALGEGAVKSEAEFKQRLSDDIKKSLTVDSDFKLLMDVREVLVKKLDGLTFPDDFLKRWVAETNEKMSAEDIDAQYPTMVSELKWHLIKEQIAKDNTIKVEDDDLKSYAKKAAQAQFAQYGMMSVPDDILENYSKEMFKDKESVNRLVDRVMDEKILAIVKSTIKLEEKKISLDDFNKMFESK